jgi:hypothetical protein
VDEEQGKSAEVISATWKKTRWNQSNPLSPAQEGERGVIPEQLLNDILSAVAEGYSFPTNLDSDPPLEGTAPQSMHHLVQHALNESWPAPIFYQALNKLLERRRA